MSDATDEILGGAGASTSFSVPELPTSTISQYFVTMNFENTIVFSKNTVNKVKIDIRWGCFLVVSPGIL